MPELSISLCLLLLHLYSSTITDWHACSMISYPLIIKYIDDYIIYKVAHVSAKFHGHRAQYKRVINVLVHDVPPAPRAAAFLPVGMCIPVVPSLQ